MNTIKPFFVALLILAATMATLTPAVLAGDDDNSGDINNDTNVSIQGELWWYIKFGWKGNKCRNTFLGKRVCKNKGSNLTCCKHSCVDLGSHEYNCGSCGAVCPFPKHCCGGKCVNVLLDPYNCGKCSNKCPHEGPCHRGLCNYAT